MADVRMNARQPCVVVFCTPETGHFQAMRPLIDRLVGKGLDVHVFTHGKFRSHVESAGATYFDLFGRYSLDEADNESRPIPCRYVSFAGTYADPVAEDVGALRPGVVIYETFSVIGPVVARALRIPYVNVCVNHNPNPARCLAALRHDERVAVSEKCGRAVERLRDRFGERDATPFSYVTSLSPVLNVYCEPARFLDPGDRAAFEPVSFFGCLPDPPAVSSCGAGTGSEFDLAPRGTLRVYVSFGTVVWRYFASEAAAALKALSASLRDMDRVSAVFSLGGAAVEPDFAVSLENDNVRVRSYVDQTAILRQADLFVTHHGLNSTHEAIFNRVPMISYPFFSDQPELARKCQRLGLAIPLTETPRAPVERDHVEAALSTIQENRRAMRTQLDAAAAWERETMDRRELVVQRVMDLMSTAPAPPR